MTEQVFSLVPLLAADPAHPLFSLLAVMLTAVVVVSLLLIRVRQSLLVGYFVCGVIIANSGFIGAIGGENTQEALQQMAEFGVMMLMFVLGMEFSISELRFLRRYALVGGGLQMGLCIVIALTAVKIGGASWSAGIVIAVALAMSSTAVSLKAFQEMGMASSPGGRFALGVAIFQDLFIIAFLVLLPLLLQPAAGDDDSLPEELGMLVVKGIGFIALAWINSRFVVPRLLHEVVLTRSRELFTLTVIGCCVGLAYIGSLLGLSLALGAFVAGLAVSESEYKHRILADIQPIKDLFLMLFFFSVGLLIDVGLAMESALPILGLTAVLVLGKAILVTGIALFLGLINRPALLGGLALCSAGEFSLLLIGKAGGAGLFDPSLQQILITSGTLSMALVPGLMKLADPIADWLERRGWGRRHVRHPDLERGPMNQRVKGMTEHAIICGYGPVGRALNRALLAEGVPTLVIELNAQTVKRLMTEGQPVLFADAAHEETWALARLETASLVAFTFPDASATATGLHHVRDQNREVCVLARARFAADQIRLEKLGANFVVHDEGIAASAVVESALLVTSRRGQGQRETGAEGGSGDWTAPG